MATMGTELEQRIVGYFRAQAGRYGLRAETLKAERVLNWGGFGAPSFRIGDGQRLLHVKLVSEPAELRRWLAVHEWLEREYHAPPVLGWVDLPGTSYAGLAFEHLDGAAWDPATRPGLVHDLRDLLGRLHDDRRLADRIGDRPRTFRECWELRYREQYEQDLAIVRRDRPACVSEARLTWMEQESREVLALAAGHGAFEGLTRAPCHWDLWPENVLVAGDGTWWVLDWDSLGVGDVAEDYATLVWPLVCEHDRDWRDLLGGERDASFAARLELHLRAITLDYVIDVLADWAECDVPEWREVVRRRKEAEHGRYLDWYRRRWG
jgi:hypothetical protein